MKHRFDGISEFVSRRGRVKLIKLLLDRGMTQTELAGEIGVSQPAVNKWLDPHETHPCNENLNCILKLAWEIDKDCMMEILRKELALFEKLLYYFEHRESAYRLET